MKYFLTIIIVIALVGGIFWYERAKASTENENTAVQTQKVERSTLEKLVSANGVVASKRDVDIKCQASGQIETLPYRDISAEVAPGAMVCQLDPKDEQPLVDTATVVVTADKARLAEAQTNHDIAVMALVTTRQRDDAALASAKARAEQAHAKAKRTQELFDSKLDSEEDLETDITAAAQADADVQTAQAAIAELDQQKLDIDTKTQQVAEAAASLEQDQTKLKTASLNLSYCTVTAPLLSDDEKADPPRWFISSMLANISPGYIVQSGTSGFSAGTTIMTLSDLSHIFVLANVDESDIGQVNDPEKGQAAQDVRVTVEAYPNEVFDGKVVRVAPKGVTTNNVTTFEVKIEVTGANRILLRPQMTATAKIVIVSHPDVLTIPIASFTRTPRNSTTRSATQPQTGGDVASADGSADASQPSEAPTPRRGRRGNRAQQADGGFSPADIFGLNTRQKGTVTVEKDDKTTETRDVTVGVASGDDYEVIDGLSEGENVVIKAANVDSKWQGRNPNGSILPRGLGGGGGGGRRGG